MTNLINKFLGAETNQEVNNLVNENIDLLNANPRLFSFVKHARKRINRIRKEQKKSYKIYEMN
jgi:hypothetical protein